MLTYNVIIIRILGQMPEKENFWKYDTEVRCNIWHLCSLCEGASASESRVRCQAEASGTIAADGGRDAAWGAEAGSVAAAGATTADDVTQQTNTTTTVTSRRRHQHCYVSRCSKFFMWMLISLWLVGYKWWASGFRHCIIEGCRFNTCESQKFSHFSICWLRRLSKCP